MPYDDLRVLPRGKEEFFSSGIKEKIWAVKTPDPDKRT